MAPYPDSLSLKYPTIDLQLRWWHRGHAFALAHTQHTKQIHAAERLGVLNGVRHPHAGISAILHEYMHDFVFALENSTSDGHLPPQLFRRFGSALHSTTYAVSINSMLPIFFDGKMSGVKRYSYDRKTTQKEEARLCQGDM